MKETGGLALQVCADLQRKTEMTPEQLRRAWEAALQALIQCDCAGCALFRLSAQLDPACFRGEITEGEIVQRAVTNSGLSEQQIEKLSVEGRDAHKTCTCDGCFFIRISSQIDPALYQKSLGTNVLELGQAAVKDSVRVRAGRPPQ